MHPETFQKNILHFKRNTDLDLLLPESLGASFPRGRAGWAQGRGSFLWVLLAEGSRNNLVLRTTSRTHAPPARNQVGSAGIEQNVFQGLPLGLVQGLALWGLWMTGEHCGQLGRAERAREAGGEPGSR